MLCPVCNETPLRGRQKICSTKCRSASYRQRKRLEQSTPQTGVPQLSNRRPRSSRREDSRRWEQLLTTATDRIVEAILKHGNGSLFQRPSGCRVDLRTQVISQAPTQAIGYRLMLPGHCASDSPKLTPKRSQARESAWYSLTPFEYPDDLRLRDGSCYRVIWIDAAGLRIRLKPEEQIPVLYFFLRPPSLPNSTTEEGPPEVVSQERDKLRVTSATSMTEDHSVRSSQSLDGPFQIVVSESIAEAGPAPVAPEIPSSATDEDHLSPVEAVVPHPEPRTERSAVSPQSVAALHQLLCAYPPLSKKDSAVLYASVIQTKGMLSLVSYDRLKRAAQNGHPLPSQPICNRPTMDMVNMGNAMMDMPRHFTPLCLELFALLQAHGTDVLQHAPAPPPQLPHKVRHQVLSALGDLTKRTYLEYVCACFDAQYHLQKVPTEPQVKLNAGQRSDLKKLMYDLRAIDLVKHRARTAAS